MSLYDYLNDFLDFNEEMNPINITDASGIRTLNDIDPMEYLNGDDDIFWWLIKYESFSNKTGSKFLFKRISELMHWTRRIAEMPRETLTNHMTR